MDVAADRPVGGSGAGTFVLARRRYREDATPVSEPHSVPLQLLADLGVVGLALGLFGAAAALRAPPAGSAALPRGSGLRRRHSPVSSSRTRCTRSSTTTSTSSP